MNEDCCSSFASSYDNSLENIGAHDSFVAYGQGWAEAGMAPFRGVKSAMAEGGVRVAPFANHSSLHNPGRRTPTHYYRSIPSLSVSRVNCAATMTLSM
jgi:arylsulfatase